MAESARTSVARRSGSRKAIWQWSGLDDHGSCSRFLAGRGGGVAHLGGCSEAPPASRGPHQVGLGRPRVDREDAQVESRGRSSTPTRTSRSRSNQLKAGGAAPQVVSVRLARRATRVRRDLVLHELDPRSASCSALGIVPLLACATSPDAGRVPIGVNKKTSSSPFLCPSPVPGTRRYRPRMASRRTCPPATPHRFPARA